MSASRYTIGIDLGTSNSALAYLDLLQEQPYSQILSTAQIQSPGAVSESPILASMLYFGTAEEQQQRLLALPGRENDFWLRYAVGAYALDQTATVPGRVASSSKSWLCHGGVDREAPILPWGSEDVPVSERLSPIAVSAGFLRHFREAWNASLGAFDQHYQFEKQDITITVPASFDEVAQRLTLEAAKQAGYPDQIRLLEEPQAALYHWLETHDLCSEVMEKLDGGRDRPASVLVCDIGGGTSDFSLFEVRPRSSPEAKPEVTRAAVSDHILLGGDNIDLALAHRLEAQISPGDDRDSRKKLSARQWRHLVFASRALKERILAQTAEEDSNAAYHVSVPGEGSSFFSQTLSTELSSAMVRELVLEGFFPSCGVSAKPERYSGALREWGLPYAADSRVTCHLAAFIAGREIDAVLFNGGMLKPQFLRRRLQSIIGSWQDGRIPIELEANELDLAVAKGAACYGFLLRQAEGQIKAAYARSLYLELAQEEEEGPAELICVLPQAFEGTQQLMLDRQFKLLVGEPVRFQLYSSTHRPDDLPGRVAAFDPQQFLPLAPMQTVLSLDADNEKNKSGLIDVKLEASLNELGMLELCCVYQPEQDQPKRWRLEFNLRKSGPAASALYEIDDAQTGASAAQISRARSRILHFYGKKQQNAAAQSPKRLIKELEESFGLKKEQWNTGLLRSLWPVLNKGITRRGRSLAHETTWLYLAGFVLRPGYGDPLDQWRIDELWRCYELGLSFPKENSALVQWWIMWRRAAGGLEQQRQEMLYERLKPRLRQRGTEDPELYRLLGSLERLPQAEKISIGCNLVERISGRKQSGIEQYIWALGRIATRVPLYASTHYVMPAAQVLEWFAQLSGLDWKQGDYRLLNGAFSQAGRVTGDRNRDLSNDFQHQLSDKMRSSGALPEQLRVIAEYVAIEAEDQAKLFGEALPAGLRLHREDELRF